jgi:hypothetical protein
VHSDRYVGVYEVQVRGVCLLMHEELRKRMYTATGSGVLATARDRNLPENRLPERMAIILSTNYWIRMLFLDPT